MVETARQALQQSLEGSESIGEAVKPGLTIDLKSQRIAKLPDGAIEILKRDVDR